MNSQRYKDTYSKLLAITDRADSYLFRGNIDRIKFQQQITSSLAEKSDEEIEQKLKYLDNLIDDRNALLHFGNKFIDPASRKIKKAYEMPGSMLEKDGSLRKDEIIIDGKIENLEMLPAYAKDRIINGYNSQVFLDKPSQESIKANALLNHFLHDSLRLNSLMFNKFANDLEVLDDYKKIEFDKENRISPYRFLKDVNKNFQEYADILDIQKKPHSLSEKAAAKTKNFLGKVTENSREKFIGAAKYTGIGEGYLFEKKPEEDWRYKNYVSRLNNMLSRASMMMYNDYEGRNYFGFLHNLRNIMSNRNLQISENEFSEIEKMINDDFDKFCKDYDNDKLRKFQAALDDVNSSMLDNSSRLQNKESEMLKFRILQGLLLMTPIGPLAIFGDAFDIINIFGDFISPLFDPNISFGKAVGEMITEKLGFLGFLPDLLQLDKVAEFIFDDIPVIKEPFEVFDLATDNDVAQGAFEFVGLANGLGLINMGILFSYTIWNLAKELDHYKDSRKVQKDHHQRLVDIGKIYSKSEDNNLIGNKSRSLANLAVNKITQSLIKNGINDQYKKTLIDLFPENNRGFSSDDKKKIIEKLDLDKIFDSINPKKGLSFDQVISDQKLFHDFVNILTKMPLEQISQNEISKKLNILNMCSKDEKGCEAFFRIIDSNNENQIKKIVEQDLKNIENRVIFEMTKSLVDGKDRVKIDEMITNCQKADKIEDGVKIFLPARQKNIDEVKESLKQDIIDLQAATFDKNARRSTPKNQINPQSSLKLDRSLVNQIV